MKATTIVFTIFSVAIAVSAAGFGNQLIRSAGSQTNLPITASEAQKAGWVPSSSGCDPNIGQPWNLKRPFPSSDYPITLYFAANGQISGFGTDVFGDVQINLVNKGYWMYVAKSQYRIQAATRAANASALCNAQTVPFGDPIGDRIIINPSKLNHRIPQTETDAQKQQWSRGACINGMGRHWEFDLQTAPVQSYNASNLLPVVPMYDNSGNLNAIFFTTTSVQQGLLGNHQWDVIPIPGALMCKNFCGNCGWPTLTPWSTMHMWFGTTSITCQNAC